MSENTNNLKYEDSKFSIENAILDKVEGAVDSSTGEKTITLDSNLKVLGSLDISGATYSNDENPEWIQVTTDSEGKILEGITAEGKKKVMVETEIQGVNVMEVVMGDGSTTDALDTLPKVYDYLKGLPNSFEGKTISIIGDSISTFTGYIPNGYVTYYPSTDPNDRAYDVRTVEDTWWKQVINTTGCRLKVNASYSGSTASNALIGFSPRVPLLDNPDIIIIALGTNDYWLNVEIGSMNFNASAYDLTKFAPAYIKGMKDTIARYPDSKIICMAFDMGQAYQDAIKQIAEHLGCSYIYVGDISDVHPNKAEMTAIAERVIKFANYTLKDELQSLNKRVSEYVDYPEFIQVTTDSEDKVLEGITTDGVKKVNIPVDNGAAIIESIDNPEYIEAKVDAEGRLIEAINKQGEKIFGVIPPQIKQYIDENMPSGSGVSSIEYDDATGDMYATYDDESGVTDVYMEPNGDIYVESEE